MARNEARSVKVWISVATLFLFAGQLLLAWEASDQRAEVCQLLDAALDRYTAGLVAAGEPVEGRTKEEQAEVEARVAVLRKTYAPVLERCD